MARSKFWNFILNENGEPVPYATVQLYNASTTTPASAYSTEAAVIVISGGTLTTDTSGYFSFWADPVLYPTGMKFDLLWSKPGTVTSGGVYDVYIPILYEQVDEADSDTTKNKLVSNELARQWEARPQLATFIAVSSSEFVAVTAGQIESGYNYYYNADHELNQPYPIVQVYVLEGRSIDNIPEYVDNDTVRIWLKSTAVSGGGEFNFILVG